VQNGTGPSGTGPTGKGDDARPEIRVGDRERQEVDARLQRAHADGVLTLTEYDERSALCWAARTRVDLERLTRDLPPDRPAGTAVEPVPAARPATRKGLAHRVVGGLAVTALAGVAAVLGGQALSADDGVSVFGNRVMQVGADQDRVEVGALFGRVTVRVPDDVRVRTDATVVFGDIDCAAACQGSPALREVVVDGTGVFGRIQVLRQNEPQGDRDRDRDRDDDQDDD
jgi:hypothetical protein